MSHVINKSHIACQFSSYIIAVVVCTCTVNVIQCAFMLLHILIVAESLSNLGVKQLGMTTNGLLLKRRLADLQTAGLTHLNISLDTLIPQKFELITRRRGWDRVMEVIDVALNLGYSPVKVYTV